ncbi:MAG: hypothetical protein JWM41_617 [Gemmatimonadetes bacterium]|nr:hypothetical protein [Gemmatimonadota bacterium]
MNMIRSLCAAAVLPACLGAQQAPERAGFYLLMGKDTLYAERSARTPTTLDGDFIDIAHGSHVAYVATLTPAGLISRLETRVFTTSGDTVGRKATLTFDGDSVRTDLGAGPARIQSANGALAMLNASPAFMEQALIHARAIANGRSTVTFLAFVVQAGQAAPLTVTFVGSDSANIELGSVTLGFAVSPANRLLHGEVAAQHLTIVRGGEPHVVAMNRYRAPPDAPYTAEDVEVRTPAGLRFTGTLTIPRGRVGGRAPAIVTITGSGPEDRDEESALLPGIRPFAELADTLGRRGIAVLRLDDRGVNGSDAGPRTVTTADFADDIRAGVAYLRTRPEIDGARIGLVGHSEGGVIAPMIAATDPQLRAIVLMAGSASTGREIVREQNRYVIDSVQHLRGHVRDSTLAWAEHVADSTAARVPWMQYFFDYDPAVTARRVKTPVLILQGETDTQVPPSEAAKLANAFRSGGNTRVTVRTFPETNHLFLADPSGAFYDANGKLRYGTLPSLHVRKEVLGAIADWLSAQFQ